MPGASEIAAPDDYEAALAPIYALAHSLVQRREAASVTRGGNLSRSVYGRSGGASLTGLAIGRVAIPAAVAAINALGLGPFRSDISAGGAAPGGAARDGRGRATAWASTPRT